jgi:uncharacterized protein (AIM24 family)
MAERDGSRPPSSRSRDVAGEDFLFHLYRGSELLQDNRVHDAKAELEQALSLQPSDPKGQDLLGIVYFRLGLYPRAITIYEQLIRAHPEAIEPRINLALSYLKTGQPAQARHELEKVVEQSPGHSRAWGYLGLAFQRLGDYERASYAFSAGGHDGMARRLVEMAATGGALSIQSEPPAPARAEPGGRETARAPVLLARELRRAAGDALNEMDRESPFHADEEQPPAPAARLSSAPPRTGTWSTTEPGREVVAPPPPLIPSLAPIAPIAAAVAVPPPRLVGPPSGPASLRAPGPEAPLRAAEVARDALLVFPRDLPVARHPSGVVLVQAASAFATRLEAVRAMAYAGGQTSAVLHRRSRGRVVDEPLGGPASPLVEITGKGELTLGPSLGHRLHPIQLDDDALYLREDALSGFEPGVTYENGRLPVGDGDAVPMVQLRGPGTVIASFPETVAALEIIEGRSTSVRAVGVLGWLGRVVPRALLASEAPSGMRGFVAFAGEGTVLIDGR